MKVAKDNKEIFCDGRYQYFKFFALNYNGFCHNIQKYTSWLVVQLPEHPFNTRGLVFKSSHWAANIQTLIF